MPKTKKPTSRARNGNGQGKGRSASVKTKMGSLEELFKHELSDMYSAEHMLVDALAEMESETTDTALAQAFAEHRQQTEGHIARLEKVAAAINEDEEELEAEICPGMKGLMDEKKAFSKERPTPEILNVFNVGAGQKSERYEITAYEGLIELARKLGHQNAVNELRATLSEEEAALKKLQTLGDRLEAPINAE